MLQRRGRLDQGQRRKSKRERTECRALYKINIFPKPLVGKTRGADYCMFYKEWSSKSEVLGVHTITRWRLVGTEVFPWRRRVEAQEQTVQAEDPMGDIARNGSPFLSALGKGGTFTPRIK